MSLYVYSKWRYYWVQSNTDLQKCTPPWLTAKEKVRETGSERRAWWDISDWKMKESEEREHGWCEGEKVAPG